MNRLILLTGPGGAGTSTLAAATVAALRDEGVTASLVDGSGDQGVSAEASVFAEAWLAAGRPLVGADPLPAEAWGAAPALTHLSTLLACQEALEAHEAVVVDAGSLASSRALVALPGVLVRLLDAALTPRLAMLRGPSGDEGAFPALSSLRVRALALARMLERESTTARIVMPPEPGAVPRVLRAVGDLACLGVGVEAVIVNRFPRSGEGWPAPVLAAARAALADVTAAAEDVPVWKSTSRLRPAPKGRSALGPFGRVAVLDAAQLTVRVAEEAFELDLPLPAAARASARVGVWGESLVIDCAGVTRWLDLPPVLTRCRPQVASRTPEGVTVRFRPDADRWPAHMHPAKES